MQAGDADYVEVPVENRSQMDELVGEKCTWDEAAAAFNCEVVDDTLPLRVYLGRPAITRTDIFFNFNVAAPDGSNPYIGSGQVDGNGVPVDFFADVHIRKAFNYCFDWDTYITDIFKGEAIQTKGLVIPGMPGWSEDAPTYFYDAAKCEEEFKLADVDKDGIAAGDDPEGDIWTTGFRVSALYNQGNTTRQKLTEIVASNVFSINELFIVETVGLPWPAFLRAQRAKILPLFFVGWQEDIHDPHNWYVPYLQTTYASRQSLPAEMKAEFGDYISRGVVELDPAKRDAIYQELNQKVYENPPGVLLAIGTSHLFYPRYVQGRIYNPLFGGDYYYTIYEE
jgi:peptide/nickel transport system substrate-binding protein